MKTYRHTRVLVAIQLQAAMMGIIGAYGLWQTINQAPGWPLFALVSLVGWVSAYRMVFQGTHPEKIEIDDKEMRFYYFGRVKAFRIEHLSQFKIKDLDPKRKVFLRIEDENGTRGRFWLSFDKYKDAEDLTYWLHDLEYRLNPNDLKYHNRRLAEQKMKNKPDHEE